MLSGIIVRMGGNRQQRRAKAKAKAPPTPGRPPLRRPQRPPSDYGRPAELRTLAGGLLDVPPLAGPADLGPATAYLQAFYDLEEWITAGRPPGKLDLQTLTPEHRVLAALDGEAFEYYRGCMLALFEQAVLRRPSVAAMRSQLSRAWQADPAGYCAFIARAWTSLPRFAAQRNNAYLQVRGLPEESGEVDSRQRLRAYLKAWADYYEVDFVLWFLAVLGRALTEGAVESEAFGGPDTTTPQGALARQAGTALAGSPLQRLHAAAYEAALRNTAQHNDYRIDGHTRGDAEVVDNKSGQRWGFAAVAERLVAAQSLGEAVMLGLMWAHDVQLAADPRRLAQRGVVSTLCLLQGTEAAPVLLLTQLWCFRDLDPGGAWLDRAELVVTVQPDGSERIDLGDVHHSSGEPVTPLLGPSIREHGGVRVLRVPVAPALGLGHPEHQLPDGERYEVVGPWDDHWVPVREAVFEQYQSEY